MHDDRFNIEEAAEAITHCEPEPLRRPLSPPQAYPMEALGSLLGNAAKSIQDTVQAPDALTGQAILTAASLATQALADIIIDGRTEPLSLWAVTIGESGERKSGVYNWALRAHYEHEKEQVRSYQDKCKAYKIEQTAYDTACKQVTSGNSNKNSLSNISAELQNVGAEPMPPISQLILLQEGTLEGIYKNLISGQPSIGLFSDDGAEFFGGHTMNKDNKSKSAAGLSILWDKGEFSRVRGSDGAGKYYGKRMALHLMIQPVIAESIFCDDTLIGQGFMARCLLAWPESTIGTRKYQPTDLSTDKYLIAYWHRVTQLLELKPALSEGTENELNPRRLTLSNDAKTLYMSIHDAIERKTPSEYVNVKAWASKGASQVLRIAGVLTLFENPIATQIEAEAINRAGLLVNYYLCEAARLFGYATIPLEIRLAESLLDWIKEKGKRHIHSGEIIQYGPNTLRNASTLNKAITTLTNAGYLSSIDGGMVFGGKLRRRAWLVIGVK